MPRPDGVTLGNWMHERSPLSLGTPELLKELCDLIFIGKEFKEACLREMANSHNENDRFQSA
jgi:hypothetical protein